MAEQMVRLIYPPNLLNMPILNQLIRKHTKLGVNIIRAEVSPNEGWLEVEFVGDQVLIDEAVVWLKEQGIEIRPISK